METQGVSIIRKVVLPQKDVVNSNRGWFGGRLPLTCNDCGSIFYLGRSEVNKRNKSKWVPRCSSCIRIRKGQQ